MSTTQHDDTDGEVDLDFDPSPQEQELIELFRDQYTTGPDYLRSKTGHRRQRINQLLVPLVSAGWVDRIAHGLYRLNYDGIDYVTHTIHYVDNEPTFEDETDDESDGGEA